MADQPDDLRPIGAVGLERFHKRLDDTRVTQFAQGPRRLIANAPLGIVKCVQKCLGRLPVLDLPNRIGGVEPDVGVGVIEQSHQRFRGPGVLDGSQRLGGCPAYTYLGIVQCLDQRRHGRVVAQPAEGRGGVLANRGNARFQVI